MSSQSFGNDPEASSFPSTSAPYHQAPQPQFPCQDARRPAYRRLVGQERFPFRVFGSDTDADAKTKFNDLGPATFDLDGTYSNTKLSTTGLMENENVSGSIIFQSHTCTEMMCSAFPAFFGSGGKCRKNTGLSSYLQPLSPLVYRTQQLKSLRLRFGT